MMVLVIGGLVQFKVCTTAQKSINKVKTTSVTINPQTEAPASIGTIGSDL